MNKLIVYITGSGQTSVKAEGVGPGGASVGARSGESGGWRDQPPARQAWRLGVGGRSSR